MASNPGVVALTKRMIIIGFILLLGSFYFQSVSVTLGVFAGVILAIVNLWLIQRAVGGLLAGQRGKLTGLYAVKLVALLGILFLLIKGLGLHPLGILAGLSVLVVVSVTGGAVMMDHSTDDDTASAEGES